MRGSQAGRGWSAHTSHPHAEKAALSHCKSTQAASPAVTFPSSRALMRKSALPCLKPKVSSPRVTEQDPPSVAGPQGPRNRACTWGRALTLQALGVKRRAAQLPPAGLWGRHGGWERRGPPHLPWPDRQLGSRLGPSTLASPRPGTGPPGPTTTSGTGARQLSTPQKPPRRKAALSSPHFTDEKIKAQSGRRACPR